MKKLQDLTGARIGLLEVICYAGNQIRPNDPHRYNHYWYCLCDCGNLTKINHFKLTGRKTLSCGCLVGIRNRQMKTTHGFAHSRLSKIKDGMTQRCYNPNHINYLSYGGRGITICEEWKEDPPAFYQWAKTSGYKPDLTIERIDNNKGYNPENCTWIPLADQPKHRRSNRYITFKGETKTLAQWGRDTKIGEDVIRRRLKKGWDLEVALTAPIDSRFSRKKS